MGQTTPIPKPVFDSSIKSVTVQFKINADFAKVVKDEAAIIAEITAYLVTTMKVNDTRIKDLSIAPGMITSINLF